MALVITCLRHAHSEKTGGFETHRSWQLSEEGRQCAARRREKLGNPTFDLVLHSPLIRARQTAFIVAGLWDSAENVVAVPELFDAATPEEQAVLDKMFEELGHAPLEKYHEHPNADTLIEFAGRAWEAVIWKLRQKLPIGGGNKILLVGHGVLLPAIVREWLISPNEFNERMTNRILKECEGFATISDLEDGGICLERLILD
ncbi:MAG: phosphoglycerate mutase family protein [Candidatus Vogelbacteria bacterium]|nr:phosphoglycerate mutase family protein [Candidatus Vogelbacteria bacterium]